MSLPTPPSRTRLVELTGQLTAAYVAHNAVQAGSVPAVIRCVYEALAGLALPQVDPAPEKATPDQIRRSINREHLISFEDGGPYKTLKRHLTQRGLSPEAYRRKWGLPADYPMVCASYSEQRSQLAREIGLGRPAAPARSARAA